MRSYLEKSSILLNLKKCFFCIIIGEHDGSVLSAEVEAGAGSTIPIKLDINSVIHVRNRVTGMLTITLTAQTKHTEREMEEEEACSVFHSFLIALQR
jgi:hypothetical protein